jgi:hypothetical protein
MTAAAGSTKSTSSKEISSMMLDNDVAQWEHEFDRRSIGRTRIAKGASLFFASQRGVRACLVRDVTNVGAGIRTQDLPLLPLNFELSFDNFRTARKCRLIWREGDYIGIAFES